MSTRTGRSSQPAMLSATQNTDNRTISNDDTYWVWLLLPGPLSVFAILRCNAVMCSDMASAMSMIVPIRPLDVKKAWLGFTIWSSVMSVDDSMPTRTACQYVRACWERLVAPRRSLFTTSFRWYTPSFSIRVRCGIPCNENEKRLQSD